MTECADRYDQHAENDKQRDGHVEGQHDLSEVERCFGIHVPFVILARQVGVVNLSLDAPSRNTLRDLAPRPG